MQEISFEAIRTASEALKQAQAVIEEERALNFAIPDTPKTPKSAGAVYRRTGTASSRKNASSSAGKRTGTAMSEGARELDRQLQHQQFQKEIDDCTLKIDSEIRKVNATQSMDFDKQFGIERRPAQGYSKTMRTLEDRTLRAQAMLSLEHYMGSFQHNKIYQELETADQWFRKQAKKFKTEFEALGIDFRDNRSQYREELCDEDDAFEENDDACDDDDMGTTQVLQSPREDKGDVAPESVDTESSAAIVSELLRKLRTAREHWKKHCANVTQQLESQLHQKSIDMTKQIRQFEGQIAQLHRQNNRLDEELKDTDEGKIRNSVEGKFQSSQGKFERLIQRQRDRLSQLEGELSRQHKEAEWLRSLLGGMGPEDKGGDGDTGGHQCNIQQIMHRIGADIRDLEEELAAREKELAAVMMEADDSRDEMRSLQAKSKQMQADMDEIKVQQSVDLQGLRYEYNVASSRVAAVREQCERLEDEIKVAAKIERGRARNTMRMSTGRSVARQNRDGGARGSVLNPRLSQMKKLVPESSVASQSTSAPAERNNNGNDEIRVQHEPQWPNVASPVRHSDLGTINEDRVITESKGVTPSEKTYSENVSIDGRESLDENGDERIWREDAEEYIPSALSNICEGAYLRLARQHVKKVFDDENRAAKKKKGRKGKKHRASTEVTLGPTEPSPKCDVLEGWEVLRMIVSDLEDGAYMEKDFQMSLKEKMSVMKRELPILRSDEAENTLTDLCLSVASNVLVTAPKLLLAQNKHVNFRKILLCILALIGIIFECCPQTYDDVTPEFTTHPTMIQFLEECGLELASSVFGGLPDLDEGEVSHEASQSKRGLGSKAKKDASSGGDSRCVHIPLHPGNIYKKVDIAVSERESMLKSVGVYKHLETVRNWTRQIVHGKVRDTMHAEWMNSSRFEHSHSQPQIFSEDRHQMCSYMIKESDVGELKVLDDSISLEDMLLSTVDSSLSFGSHADIRTLMKTVLPVALPLVLILEFSRRVIDEDIHKRDLMDKINNGENEELAFLRTTVNTASTASEADKRRKLDSDYFDSLSSGERFYLMEMKKQNAALVQEIMNIMDAGDDADSEDDDADDDDDEEPDAIPLTRLLKQAILSHMMNLEENTVRKFSKDSLDRVKSEIESFEQHIATLSALRDKTLDVGGMYTKPFREKLDGLNSSIIATIAENNEKENSIRTLESDISDTRKCTDIIIAGMNDIVNGKMKVISPELEDLLLRLSPDQSLRASRIAAREALEGEEKILTESVKEARENYETLFQKICSIASALSYTASQALRQGGYLVSSLIEEILQHKLKVSVDSIEGKIMHDDRPTHITLPGNARHRGNGPAIHSTSISEKDLNGIIIRVLEYLGPDAVSQLGAMLLDSSIDDGMNAGLKLMVDAREKSPSSPSVSTRTTRSTRIVEKQPKRSGYMRRVVEVEKGADSRALPKLITATDISNVPPQGTDASDLQSNEPRRSFDTRNRKSKPLPVACVSSKAEKTKLAIVSSHHTTTRIVPPESSPLKNPPKPSECLATDISSGSMSSTSGDGPSTMLPVPSRPPIKPTKGVLRRTVAYAAGGADSD